MSLYPNSHYLSEPESTWAQEISYFEGGIGKCAQTRLNQDLHHPPKLHQYLVAT
jgi:hypothetical protein